MSPSSSSKDEQQDASASETMASPSLSSLPSHSGASTPALASRTNAHAAGMRRSGSIRTRGIAAMDGFTAIRSVQAGDSASMPVSPTNGSSLKAQDATIRMMLAHMYRTGLREEWLHDNDANDQQEGIFMICETARRGIYSHPVDAETEAEWVKELLLSVQAPCAVVTKPTSTDELLKYVPLHPTITLETGEDIPIVDDLSQASMLAPNSGCLLVRSTGLAVSYGSAVDVLHMARQLDAALVNCLFAYTIPALPSALHTAAIAVQQERQQRDDEAQEIIDQQPDAQQRGWLSMLPPTEKPDQKAGVDGKNDVSEKKPEPVVLVDQETGEAVREPERTSTHVSALLTGFGVAVNMVIMSIFARDIVMNTLEDRNYMRALLLAAIIPRFLVAQYFCDHIILIIAQLVFPVSQMHRNTLYYSGQPSAPLAKDHKLPHFTIHMPCYKEGLQTVLAPTLKSILAAVHAYRAQGGTANVVVSEDGLRLLSKQEAEERVRFYNAMGCSWVARPADGDSGYKRLGRFKKASNLNFTYTLSLRLEKVIGEVTAARQQSRPAAQHNDESASLSQIEDEEESIYAEALQRVLDESNGRAWAAGNIRMGDYILLIDSDTRVPENCLMQAAAEMERSPDVGALQHCSGITYVQHHYFERLLGYFVGVFTNFTISWVCSNGAMAPLMGHNVFLRWTALQQVADKKLLQEERQIFSSQHVSEDYELAMRLQMAGYCVRWATYSNQEFREGVSLNPSDEKARWQKYAFGACEILFNPFVRWYKGPFTGLFWRFMWSRNVHTAGKLGMLSYLFSYFALGISLPLTVTMAVVQGLFWPTLDTSFRPVFDTWIAVIVVFNLAGAIGLLTVRARAGHSTLLRSLWEGFEHLPAIVVFFSGITYHVAASILAFFFSVRMSWQATSKDFQQTSIREVVRRFWHCYLTMGLLLALTIVGISPLVPAGWRIETFTILFPVFLAITMHFLFPILLDPGILHKFIPRYYASEVKAVEPKRDFFYGANADEARQKSFRLNYQDEKVGLHKSPRSSFIASTPSSGSLAGGMQSPNGSARYINALPYEPAASLPYRHHRGTSFGAPISPGVSIGSIGSQYDLPATVQRMPSYFHSRPGWHGSRPGHTPGVASSVATSSSFN
ncbi:Glyco_trans_2-like domain-containing protein [Pseudozyma hubeiensis]|nr:Glyco_trans_2-like domain-containing protein [Pseudozyma hubeiensis]